MAAEFYRKYTRDEIRAAFSYFDKDNSGYISPDELRQVLYKMGRNYTKEEIEGMIRESDRDGKFRHKKFSQKHFSNG